MGRSKDERAGTREVELGIDGLGSAVEIGRGGFGVVYRARQPSLDRTVAVKLLTSRLDTGDRARFEREGRAMGMLFGHPNIVSVLATGLTDSGQPYIAMAYVPGGSLAARIRQQGALPWVDAVGAGIKLAGALETAHRRGLLHRDVKPENVLLTDYGEPQLADFGIARVHGGYETESRSVTASLAHAPPEVLDGQPATAAGDVYSLGSTLFTLLAGHPPFPRRPEEALAAHYLRIAREPPPDLRPAGVPQPVCLVLEQALAKEPQQRQGSAAELGRQLQDAQRQAGIAVTQMAMSSAGGDDIEIVADDDGATRSEGRVREVAGALLRRRPARSGGGGRTRHSRRPMVLAVAAAILAAAGLAGYQAVGRDDDEPSRQASPAATSPAGPPSGCGAGGTFRDPVQAHLTATRGLAVGPADNMFVVDNDRHRVLRITQNGEVSTVAGTGQAGFSGDGGPGREAQLSDPQGVALGADGAVYISDKGNNRIRRVGADGTVTTVAGSDQKGADGDGGQATAAALSSPHGVAVAPDGTLYIVDTGNRRVRRVAPDGLISTLAGAAQPPSSAEGRSGGSGGGGGAGAKRTTVPTAPGDGLLVNPYDVTVGPDGSVFVSDRDAHRVYRLAGDGALTPVAGSGEAGFAGDGGPANSARLSSPHGIVVGSDGALYIADRDNHRVRRVAPDSTVTTIAGNGEAGFSGDGGPATAASLRSPRDVASGVDGSLFISDADNCRVRQVGPRGVISTRAR